MSRSKSNTKVFCLCPWCGIQDGYKTTKGMNCFRCGKPVDKNGDPIWPKLEPVKDKKESA